MLCVLCVCWVGIPSPSSPGVLRQSVASSTPNPRYTSSPRGVHLAPAPGVCDHTMNARLFQLATFCGFQLSHSFTPPRNTTDSYGDLLADIDDLNFGTANPHSHEHDYMPTESSDMDISKLSVGERLYYIGCGMERNKQERLRREREHQVVSELSQVTAKPMITQRARELANKGLEFPEKSVLWSKRLEKERRKQSAKHCMDNIAENLQTVQMNPRSAAMLERGRLKNSYKSPIKGWNTHFARYTPQLFPPNRLDREWRKAHSSSFLVFFETLPFQSSSSQTLFISTKLCKEGFAPTPTPM